MLKNSILFVALCAVQFANAECVMQNKTVTRQQITIQERSDIRRNVITDTNNQRRCVVDFKVRVGAEWHQASGDVIWDGAQPSDHACALAVTQAERDVESRLQKRAVANESIMVCTDNPDRDRLKQTNPGTVAKVEQFRPHPDYPKSFYHNGTQCRYFLETGYANQDVRNYSGVICRLENNDWVVVDKF